MDDSDLSWGYRLHAQSRSKPRDDFDIAANGPAIIVEWLGADLPSDRRLARQPD